MFVDIIINMDKTMSRVIIALLVAVAVFAGVRYFMSNHPISNSGNVRLAESEDEQNFSADQMIEQNISDMESTMDPRDGDGTSQISSALASEPNVIGSSTPGVYSMDPNAKKARQNGCFPKDVLSPQDLLPQDNSTTWAQVNPQGTGTLKDRNFLQAGHHIGVNTVGQTLRNPNLQLRSEPANPQVKVSPWLQATINPDVNRKPFEIGGCA